MFSFGFSYTGCIYLLMLFVPNIFWSRCRPKDYEKYAGNENRILLIFERTGQVLATTSSLVFSDFNIRKTWWALWLILSFFFMVLYELYWIRYFKGSHTMKDMYGSFMGIPDAGAVLPVIAFGLLAVYGGNAFLFLSVMVLGIGHIGIHLNHRRETDGIKKPASKPSVLKWLLRLSGSLLVLFLAVVLSGRNLNYFRHYTLLQKGVDKAQYVFLGGQKQYILARGMDCDNPVIIYLHGGPASPDTMITYSFSDYLVDDYTVLAWDQRGCGRTYYANQKEDRDNETASFGQALEDLDDLVDYARKEYHQDRVIILSHSYGSVLGSVYARKHPDKVYAYIGAAQVTSLGEADRYSFEDARAKANGDAADKLEKAYETYLEEKSIFSLIALRQLLSPYHKAKAKDKSIKLAVFSPYLGVDDFRWLIRQAGDKKQFVSLNKKLFDYLLDFDVEEQGLNYDIPALFISGSCDWTCPVKSVNKYVQLISAPCKAYVVMEGPGHNLQFSRPEEFAKLVKELLQGIDQIDLQMGSP